MSYTDDNGPMMTMDGKPLKRSLAIALRRQKIRALLLISPLLIFVLFTFLFPIASMLFRSVENDIVSEILPETVVALYSWDAESDELPDEIVYSAFAGDLQRAAKAKDHMILRAWPSSCIRLSSATPLAVQRSVGMRASARVLPSRSNARHLTAPVLKSHPVMIAFSGTHRIGSVISISLSK